MPGCDDRTTTVPATPVRVSTLPVSEAGPDTAVNVTGRPDVAVAASVNGPAEETCAVSGDVTVIVWASLVAVTVVSAIAAR